jgi:hypothetical protein
VAYFLGDRAGGSHRVFGGFDKTLIPTLILWEILKNLHFKLGHYPYPCPQYW